VKRCGRCKTEKTRVDFYASSSARGGLQNYCKECTGISKVIRHASNPDKRRIYENSESRKAAKRAWHEEVVKRRPGYLADRYLSKTYGISLDDYNRMLSAQGGVCAMCKSPEKSKFNGKDRRLCVDHCHKTGKIRGLLCVVCNACARPDDIAHLQMRVAYLRSHSLSHKESDVKLMIANVTGVYCG
jgi:hypothetical protein